jgi:3-(3-hydroxy-phenyl)propionate hydroxylase
VPPFDTDVLVVGAGPCGLTVANLLGVYGVRTTVVERSVDIVAFPRAVGIDDESLRSLQTAGLVDEVLTDTLQNTPIRYYTSWGRCFAHVKPSAQPFGWPRRNLFLQPLLEAALRKGVTRFDDVEVRYGTELVDLLPDASGVSASVKDLDGNPSNVRARYVVGADGGRSAVRDLTGIPLTGTTAPVKWLVVDVADDHLDAPYSAVYCHPERPVLCVPLPYGRRRWEFKVQPGDDEAGMTEPDNVLRLLQPHYPPGVPMPEIVSSRVYLHHSRTAATFQQGRIFLAGDAAHLQPPFFGQGMNSGIRDATNLAWKLAAVLTGRAGPDLLATYDSERRPHAAAMVSFATRIGRMYSPRSLATERIRDVAFRVLHLVPGGKEYILQMKYKPMPTYTDGVVVANPGRRQRDEPVGRMFMQPPVETADHRRARFDDAIGPGFAVIGIGCAPWESLAPELVGWWRSLGARFVRVDPSRQAPRPRLDAPDVVLLEDVQGAFRDWLLARPRAEVIVLRPDRYVAAVTDRAGLEAATVALRGRLGIPVAA